MKNVPAGRTSPDCPGGAAGSGASSARRLSVFLAQPSCVEVEEMVEGVRDVAVDGGGTVGG